jgi:hypothetical protein
MMIEDEWMEPLTIGPLLMMVVLWLVSFNEQNVALN